jgi:Cft2 family RNA processing exonuclease
MGESDQGERRDERVTALLAISGLGGKGPACFLVEAGGARLLLDLGYGPQPGVWPDVTSVGRVDALLLSHSHRDHAGALDLRERVGQPPVYATNIVQRLLGRSIACDGLPLHGSTRICGIQVTTGRNGHAPGGVWLHLDIAGGLLYMGDCSIESALYAFDEPPAADTIIVDASYGAYDEPLSVCTARFHRVFDAGPALLPVPAAGRGPEIALHLVRSGRALPHIDDALRAYVAMLLHDDRASVRSDAMSELARICREAPPIDSPRGVMLACVADATSGRAADLVARWEHAEQPAIVFSGYIPAGTPAERLTRSERASYIRWNVHPTLSDNARLVRNTRARTVLPAFGDGRHLPAWQAAFAPARVVIEGAVTL